MRGRGERFETMALEGKVTIERIDLGPGWVCFQAGNQKPSPENLPGLLHHTFYTWLQRNKEFR